MKKSGVILGLLGITVLLISMISSVSLVSASWFDNILDKITGKVTENVTNGGDGEPEPCPTILGWRVENNKCIEDSGCDYDDSEYTYYDSEEECISQLEPPPEPDCPEIPTSELCPDEETLCPQTTDENGCPAWDCDACETKSECEDSDGGKDYYVRGTLGISCAPGEPCPVALCGSIPAPGESSSTCLPPSDWCADESVLNEGYCENGNLLFEEYNCPDGCEDGACIKEEGPDEPPYEPRTCAARISISFDKNVYYVEEEFKVKMKTFDAQGNPLPHYSFYIQAYDYESGAWKEIGQDRTGGNGYKTHQDKIKVDEPLRFGKNKIKIITKVSKCDSVEDIAIIEIKRKEGPEPVPCGMGSCIPEEDVEEVEAIPEDKIFYKCNGCELEGKCYPMGYRKSGQYCSDDFEFVGQEEGTCDNNFECKSNVCISGECVGEGLVKKILKWFKKMFGDEDEDEEDEEPGEKACSKLLLEHNIGEYEYTQSLPPGGNEHMLVPIHSEDGEHIGTVKCCAALYKDKKDKGYGEHGVLFCPYNNKEDVTNSVKWIIAKERNIGFKEYEGEKVFASVEGRGIIGWINNAYLIAVGAGPTQMNVPLPEKIAKAYLKKYPSEFELTEDDIPDAPPERPWVYCTEEDEKKGEKCKSQAGAQLQTDPNPEDKSCEVYVGCILPNEKCEGMDDIKEREDCYVRVAEMTGDSSVCEKITSDESRKNKCYVKAAETSKNSKICEKITEDDIKEMCFELVEVFPWEICTSKNDMLKEECYFTDDFEDGADESWIFHNEGVGGDWSIVEEDGNKFLRLHGVIQPDLQRYWDDHIFKFRFKRIEGSVHVNFRKTSRREGQSRYIVAISEGVNNLNKHFNVYADENWQKLDDTHFRFDENWHTLEIRGYNNILNVYLDNELLYNYKDTESPFLSGMPGFEIHTGGRPITPEFLIDDVEVRLISEEDIVYP